MVLVDEADGLYTDEVKRHMYAAKALLPADFPLITVEREIYGGMQHDTIIIQVLAQYYNWRTVENRLQIIMTLRHLRDVIRKEGIRCLIEKPDPIQG